MIFFGTLAMFVVNFLLLLNRKVFQKNRQSLNIFGFKKAFLHKYLKKCIKISKCNIKTQYIYSDLMSNEGNIGPK